MCITVIILNDNVIASVLTSAHQEYVLWTKYCALFSGWYVYFILFKEMLSRVSTIIHIFTLTGICLLYYIFMYKYRYWPSELSITWAYLMCLWCHDIFFNRMGITDLLKSEQSQKICPLGLTNVSFCYLNSMFRDSWSYLQILL